MRFFGKRGIRLGVKESFGACRRWVPGRTGQALAGALAGSLGGCGAKMDPTLPPEAFVNRRPAIGPDSNEPISRSGGLVYDSQREPVHRTEPPLQISSITADAQSPATSQPSEPVTTPSELPTQPSTFPTTLAAGQYQSIGGVHRSRQRTTDLHRQSPFRHSKSPRKGSEEQILR